MNKTENQTMNKRGCNWCGTYACIVKATFRQPGPVYTFPQVARRRRRLGGQYRAVRTPLYSRVSLASFPVRSTPSVKKKKKLCGFRAQYFTVRLI